MVIKFPFIYGESMDLTKINPLLILGIIVVIVALFASCIGITAISTYNDIQNLNIAADTQWAKVETVYQERFDLIPRIVQSVVAQTDAEKQVLNNIADARSRFISGKTLESRTEASASLDRSLNSFFPIVLQENYPNVQFAQAFRDFRVVYEGQENRIRVERNRYNDAVKSYNQAIKTFPGNVFAGYFGFSEKPFFQSASGSEKAPELNFGQNNSK
jgi:LemA protein